MIYLLLLFFAAGCAYLALVVAFWPRESKSGARLKAAMQSVGVEHVCAIMETAGWTRDDDPPKWAWWQAVRLAGRNTAYILVVHDETAGG